MSGRIPRPSPEALNSVIRYMEASAKRLERAFERGAFEKGSAWSNAMDAMRLGQSAQWLRENAFDCPVGFLEETPGFRTYYHCELPGGHGGAHACGDRRWSSLEKRR